MLLHSGTGIVLPGSVHCPSRGKPLQHQTLPAASEEDWAAAWAQTSTLWTAVVGWDESQQGVHFPPSSPLLNDIRADSNILVYFLISQCYPIAVGLVLLLQTLKWSEIRERASQGMVCAPGIHLVMTAITQCCDHCRQIAFTLPPAPDKSSLLAQQNLMFQWFV